MEGEREREREREREALLHMSREIENTQSISRSWWACMVHAHPFSGDTRAHRPCLLATQREHKRSVTETNAEATQGGRFSPLALLLNLR